MALIRVLSNENGGEVVKLLLEYGADVNLLCNDVSLDVVREAYDCTQETILHAMSPSIESFVKLSVLSSGFDMSYVDENVCILLLLLLTHMLIDG